MGLPSVQSLLQDAPRTTPLIRWSGGLAAGVWVYHSLQGRLPWLLPLSAVFFLVLTLFCGRPVASSAQRVRWLAYVTMALLAGMSWSWFRLQETDVERSGLRPRDLLEVEGIVSQTTLLPVPPSPSSWNAIPRGKRQTIRLQQCRVRKEGHWQNSPEAFLLYLEDRSPAANDDRPLTKVRIGQRVRASGRFSWPRAVHNPGQFDTRAWLHRTGISGQMSVTSPEDVQIIDREVNWISSGNQLKTFLRQLLHQHVPPKQQGMALAMLLGERSQLASDEKVRFAGTGTIHILAISGLHLGILTGLFLWIGIRIGLPRNQIFCAAIVLVIFYAWLVEFRAPIVRAAALTVVMCCAAMLRRRSFSINSLAVALFVLLILDPEMLVLPGTHLSFLAVASLVTLYRVSRNSDRDHLNKLRLENEPIGRRRWHHVCQFISAAYKYSSTVFVVCLPMVVYQFHLAAWIGLLVNPLVIPPMMMALIFGFATLLFGGWWPGLAMLTGTGCGWSLGMIQTIVDYAYRIPGSHQYLASPGLGPTVIWYLLLILTTWIGGRRLRPGHVLLSFLLLFLVMHAVPWNPCPERQGSQRQMTLTFLDVGHGNCTIIRSPDGKVMLCDAGSFPDGDSGGRKIADVLWSHGIETIDDLVISHADLDHYNALPWLMERFRIRRILVAPGTFDSSEVTVNRLRAKVEAYQIPIVEIARGDLELQDYQARVLSPPRSNNWRSDNARSLVVKLGLGDHNVLLTGDVEDEGLEFLLAEPKRPITVLQVPHHGSANNEPRRVIAWTQPEHAIISALEHRVKPEVRQIFQEEDVTVHIPSKSGAVLLNLFQDGSLELRCWDSQPWSVR